MNSRTRWSASIGIPTYPDFARRPRGQRRPNHHLDASRCALLGLSVVCLDDNGQRNATAPVTLGSRLEIVSTREPADPAIVGVWTVTGFAETVAICQRTESSS